MDKEQFLLLKVMEEAAEVQQMCSKCIQFGMDERYKDGPTNLERLMGEVDDLCNTLFLLEESSEVDIFPPGNQDDFIYSLEMKRDKLNKYLKISSKEGRIGEDIVI